MQSLKLSELNDLAKDLGLVMATNVGYNCRNYKFAPRGSRGSDGGYFAFTTGIVLNGAREATLWLRGYQAAHSDLFYDTAPVDN